MKFFKNWLTRKNHALPVMTTPYNQTLKKKQEVLVFSLVIAIAVAGFYTYFYTQNQIKAEEKITVMVTSKDLPAPHEITAGDLETIQLPRKLLPIGTHTTSTDLVGKSLVFPLKAKQLVLTHYTQPDLDPDSISAQFTDWFALSMDEDWFVAKWPNIKPNDRIDLLVTNPRGELSETTALATDLTIIDIHTKSKKKYLVANTTEDQAKAILFARGLKLPMQLLVRPGIKLSNHSEQ